MIEFDMDPGAMHVLGLWYVSWPGHDWLACVSRKRDERNWTLQYRFRYYSGTSDPFDESDRKSWYSGEIQHQSPAEIAATMDLVAATISGPHKGKTRKIIVNGDGRAAYELLCKEPFVHIEALDK